MFRKSMIFLTALMAVAGAARAQSVFALDPGQALQPIWVYYGEPARRGMTVMLEAHSGVTGQLVGTVAVKLDASGSGASLFCVPMSCVDPALGFGSCVFTGPRPARALDFPMNFWPFQTYAPSYVAWIQGVGVPQLCQPEFP